MNVDFEKFESGLVPAVIQHIDTAEVLMLGYMNKEAFDKTCESGVVTFFSRSKQRLWTKGETSGNFLRVKSISLDCDRDALLVLALPAGPVCHTGNISCFSYSRSGIQSLHDLERIIKDRLESGDEHSYTRRLMSKGIAKVAQKVGEEAVELVIESMREDKELFLNEAADLMFHYLMLLKAKGFELNDVLEILNQRHNEMN